MITNNIAKAYQTVVESQISKMTVDEDEETSTKELLTNVAEGLKGILENIEKYLSRSGEPKTLKLPENPEDTSWIPSVR